MYHWYLLIRARSPGSQARHTGYGFARCELGSKGRPSPEEQRRLFWMGLVEAVPIAAAYLVACFLGREFVLLVVLGGVACSALLCWLLRKCAPKTPIGLSVEDKPAKPSTRENRPPSAGREG